MRTLGFRTHVLLSLAAAAGMLFALERPWYAAAPGAPKGRKDIGDINGPLDQLFQAMQRWVTSPDGTTGWESLGHWGVALGAMAGMAAIGALASLLPPLQPLGRDLLRYSALAAFGIAAWKLVDQPGPNAAAELRHGAIAAAACSLVLLTCGMGVANAPMRRKSKMRTTYEAPPAPQHAAYGSSGSNAPPGA